MGVVDDVLSDPFSAQMIGLGISFSLAIFLTILSDHRNVRFFMVNFVVFVAICTWASLLDAWIMILVIIGGLVAVYLEYKEQSNRFG